MPDTIKISVLADGKVLLDGEPASLARVKQTIGAAPPEAVVWYYRQNAAGEPPPEATEVMKAITDRRLAVRLSSQPDFTDSVVPATVTMEKLFAPIREKAAQGNLLILRPNGQYLVMPAIPREKADPAGLASMEKLLPSHPRRNVAVIADTAWTMEAAPGIQLANQKIPFFGMLIGLATIGHAVWIVGPDTDLAGACREADLLIVDSACRGVMPRGWDVRARAVMRNREILIHDREAYRLVALG